MEFDRFEFRVFLLLDWLPHQGWRTQSVLQFTHSWKENNWIDAFDDTVKVLNHTVRCWVHLILSKCYLLDLLLWLGAWNQILVFRPTWLYLIIEVLATQKKFLETSSYCTVINYTFTFCIGNVFGCFHGVIVLFKLVNHKFLS